MFENSLLLLIGLFLFCLMAVVGEYFAKKYEWE